MSPVRRRRPATPPASLADAAGDTAPARRLEALAGAAPWVLRVGERKGTLPPLLVVRHRDPAEGPGQRGDLRDRGCLHGVSLRRALPAVRLILSRVLDDRLAPLELHQHLDPAALTFRGNLPLDEEAGAKLALIFKLQERVKEADRVELIARRVERFTREEAGYWLSRLMHFGDDANRWAAAGLRVVLGGQPRDPGVLRALEQLRARG